MDTGNIGNKEPVKSFLERHYKHIRGISPCFAEIKYVFGCDPCDCMEIIDGNSHTKYAFKTYCSNMRCVLKKEPFKAMAWRIMSDQLS